LLLLMVGLPIVLVLAWYHGDNGHHRVGRRDNDRAEGAAVEQGLQLIMVKVRLAKVFGMSGIASPSVVRGPADHLPVRTALQSLSATWYAQAPARDPPCRRRH
jgi:hypothetical protein